ncbi:hypothetical protein [Oceanobacter sp. 3_MG-2023]|uniref:hypothetical protein n=1 Tax=Oceanobacter sp. 3_MG-2023 TaxID=3062622 RepID=UPI00273599D5|nr:hypothetical protein [Oceanobacter sp. 3_MG-2023]MDP2505826.1 hypothetical protein [Oceanobacter sp. 3_MG-2023]
MEIAPNFTAKQWKSLDLESNEDDWQKAIGVLCSRLSSRYLEPVDKLIEFEKKLKNSEKRFGFTVLEIDLLLIETLQAFKEGLESTDGKSKKVFVRFLKTSPYFCEYFHTKEQRDNFYKEFRCGILHQAEIQSSALVWSFGDMYERIEGMKVLNRNAVHEALKKDFADYIEKLKSPESLELRKKFKQKMDSVANRDTNA